VRVVAQDGSEDFKGGKWLMGWHGRFLWV